MLRLFLKDSEVLIAVTLKTVVFWYVTPCSLVYVYTRFGGMCWLHFDD
jgi:hypothetical protein